MVAIARELITDEPIVVVGVLGDRNFATGTGATASGRPRSTGTTALACRSSSRPARSPCGAPARRRPFALSSPSWWALGSYARLLVAAGFGFLALRVLLARLTFDVAWSNIRVRSDVPERARRPADFISRCRPRPPFGTLCWEHMGGATGIQPDAQPGRGASDLGGHHAALPARRCTRTSSWRGRRPRRGSPAEARGDPADPRPKGPTWRGLSRRWASSTRRGGAGDLLARGHAHHVVADLQRAAGAAPAQAVGAPPRRARQRSSARAR